MTVEKLEDKLIVEGINSMGYGLMPKTVAKDKRLTIEAKAIYAYFVSYAGAGTSAFPSLKTILSDLNISENRFYKHRKLLIEFGYISVKAERKGKIVTKNIYTLHTNPMKSVDKEVSSKMKDNLSSKTEDNPILQNEGGRILTGFNINNIKDDDELNKNTQLEKLEKLIQEKTELKYLAQELFNSNIPDNEILKILNYFNTHQTEINADAIEQQLKWMTAKSKTDVGISSYSVYFIKGYNKRVENMNVDVGNNVAVNLKEKLGLFDEDLPKVPMFNWLEKQ